MKTFRSDNLHYSAFLLCENFKLIDARIIDLKTGVVEFTFENKPGIDLGNIYRTWSVDGYLVPCRLIFTYYNRLRDLIEMAKREARCGQPKALKSQNS